MKFPNQSFNIKVLHVKFMKTGTNNSTVKPVYNGHPWDLKNVVVMQRVV